jgi:hypothetical protein
MKLLESNSGWLSNYNGPDKNESHIVGNSLTDIDETKTELLHQLSILNKEREHVLNLLKA